ncbi:enoyl-CoA hydratase/isomerase family protein [Chachezhania sediminis]|uniref:enoyl-CoA hydratase/isomerase family protein n=1 Tax=Chachezhania sediminis TaxID=2599291 RepID=UPI0018EF17F6|nr:enoyl-CoA hydratase/isomerase family protein [Chachezhania sediminis]
MTGDLGILDHAGWRELRLARPDRGNALSEPLVGALAQALDAAVADDVPLLVLRGEGRHFCTGFDLSDLEDLSDGDLLARFVRIEMLLDRVARLSVPTLVLAQGRTMGAGADLFAACRYRLLLVDAKISFPGVNFGLVLGTRRLARRIGADAARDILLSGRTVDAAGAQALGLAGQTIEAGTEDAAVAGILARETRLPRATAHALEEALADPADSDGDLARLVRSAVAPGLKDRILAYRATLAAARKT